MTIADDRLRLILDWLEQEKSVSVRELTDRLKVSTMTVWRDLRTLHDQGLATRVRGGILRKGADSALEPLFETRYAVEVEKKRAIGRHAAMKFVSDGEIIILEGGTTVGSMVPYINHDNLTIITNNLNILVQAANRTPSLTVMTCGGILREHTPTFVGPHAELFFAQTNAHKYFFGAVALNLTDGITDPDPLEIQVKRVMSRSAQMAILLLDSSKFGKRSLAQIFPLNDVDVLITDKDAPKDAVAELRSRGIDVHVVDY